MYENFDNQFKDIHPLVNYNTRINSLLNIRDEVDKIIPSNKKLSNTIADDGYVSLGTLLHPRQINEINYHLKDKLAYDSHVPPGSSGLNKIEDIRKRKASACYPLETILTCPHILELALHRDILSIAEIYLGMTPTLYSINIFHTFAEPQYNYLGGIKSFHRDADDVRFLCLFVYLVDVDENTGPHIYIKYTHHELNFMLQVNNLELKNKIFPPNMMTGHGNDELFEKELQQYIVTLTGPAGSGFFADTFGIHRGSNLTKDRLVLWIRYGTHKNGPARDQIPEPLSNRLLDGRFIFDEKLKFITRVLLKHD